MLDRQQLLERTDRVRKRLNAAIRAGASVSAMGLTGSVGDVNRFLARLDVAIKFEEARFSGFSGPTRETYSSLIRLFLAWSAFERMAHVIGMARNGTLNYQKLGELLSKVSLSGDKGTDRSIAALYPLLAETSKGALKRTLETAGSAQPLSATNLLKALRHAFVHGVLTAHAGGVRPARLRHASDLLTQQLIEVQLANLETRLEPMGSRKLRGHGGI